MNICLYDHCNKKPNWAKAEQDNVRQESQTEDTEKKGGEVPSPVTKHR